MSFQNTDLSELYVLIANALQRPKRLDCVEQLEDNVKNIVVESEVRQQSYGVPDQAVAKALNDAITKTSLKCRKSNLKEIHVVNETESILHQFVSELLEDSRPKLFRRVSVTRLSDEEVQKVIEDKVIAKEHRSDGKPLVESLDNLYTAVEKPVRQISSEKPPVPYRKNKPNIAMPKKKYTAQYENVAPPVPQKNPELLRQLQDIGQTGNGSNPPTVDEKVTPYAARNDQDAGLGTKGKQVTPEGVHRGLGKVGREKEGNNAGITTVPPEGLLGEEKKTPSPIKDDEPALYDLAGPLPSMNTGTRPNLKLDQGKGTENYAYEEVTPIQAYVTKKASETPEDKVIVDKRHYNYLCKFKKNDIQRIRKACQVDISPAPGSDCNNIEVQFVKAQKGTCSKWRRRFIELYELWEDKLVIERINLAEIENENKLLGKINGISEHFSDQDNNTLEIICEKKSIDQIRKIVDKFKVKAAKQKVNLTVDSGNAEIQPS